MSRDASGNYSLPAGNPVVTGTPITIAWANGTLNDIATVLTASLDRSGNGAMLASLKGFDGVLANPGYTFGSESGLGLYRVSAGVLGFAVGGAQVMRYNSAGVTITGTTTQSGVSLGPAGAVGAPSYSFSADATTGMYRPAASSIGFAGAGALMLTLVAATALFATTQISNVVGSAAAPSYSFTGDLNTGMSAAVADTLVLSTAGTARLTLSAANLTFPLIILGGTGGQNAPTYSFTGDTDTGMYASVADSLRFTAGGTLRFTINTTDLTAAVPFLALNAATAATPDIAFAGDPNTGFLSPSADELQFSLGGTAFFIGYRNIPQNIQAANYTLLVTDAGKHIYHANGAGAGDTYTIPANASVAYVIGTVLTFINSDSNAVSIAITSDTMTLAGTTTTGTRSLAQNGVATAVKVTATAWIISGTGLS